MQYRFSGAERRCPLKCSLIVTHRGRGAGNRRKWAGMQHWNIDDVKQALASNTKMAFVTAGMGGGTEPQGARDCRNLSGVEYLSRNCYHPFPDKGNAGLIRRLKFELKTMWMHLVINNEESEMYGDFGISKPSQSRQYTGYCGKGIRKSLPFRIHQRDFADVKP